MKDNFLRNTHTLPLFPMPHSSTINTVTMSWQNPLVYHKDLFKVPSLFKINKEYFLKSWVERKGLDCKWPIIKNNPNNRFSMRNFRGTPHPYPIEALPSPLGLSFSKPILPLLNELLNHNKIEHCQLIYFKHKIFIEPI